MKSRHCPAPPRGWMRQRSEAMGEQATVADAMLEEREFRCFQRLMFDEAGIQISAAKRIMVQGRLMKRLKALALSDYRAYLAHVEQDAGERQRAIDLLTTNETYFFREPRHFDFLSERVLPGHPRNREFRVWSAACSSGEEPYSLAMLLADRCADGQWRITASDISSQVLSKARTALYPMSRADRIPKAYLQRFCLRGTKGYEGCFLIDRRLRASVEFHQINLSQRLPEIGVFEVIFLRNALIYFNADMKRAVVGRLVQRLAAGGFLIVGHSESLNGLVADLQPVAPSIYRKPLRGNAGVAWQPRY